MKSGQMLRMDNYFFVLASRHHIHVNVDMCADLESGVKVAGDCVNRCLSKRRVFQKLFYVEQIEEVILRVRQLQKILRRKLVQLLDAINPGWDSISLSAVRELAHPY